MLEGNYFGILEYKLTTNELTGVNWVNEQLH